jgi:hypothetical protein
MDRALVARRQDERDAQPQRRRVALKRQLKASVPSSSNPLR